MRRLGGATAIVASVFGAYLSFLFGVVFGVRYSKVAFPIVLIDLIIFILMLGIALRSRKFWPMWVGAFTGVMLLSHLAPLMPGMLPRIYYDATALWS
jgi:TctA family transporter